MIYLYELQIENDPNILKDIETLIDDHYSLSFKSNSYVLILEDLILKSKLSQIKGDLDQADSFLLKATELAEEKRLMGLSKKIKLIRNDLISELENCELLLAQNVTLQEKTRKAKIADYFRNALEVLQEEE